MVISDNKIPEYTFEIQFPENLIEGDIRGIFLGIRRIALLQEKYKVLKDYDCKIYIKRQYKKDIEIIYEMMPTPFPLMEMTGMSYGDIVGINHYFDIDFLEIKGSSKIYIGCADKDKLLSCKLSW